MSSTNPEGLNNLGDLNPDNTIHRAESKTNDTPPTVPTSEMLTSTNPERYLGFIPEVKKYKPPYTLFNSPQERAPSVDGSIYVHEAFGGFGPDSPEYDKGPRLKIVVPNFKEAISWFKYAEIAEGSNCISNSFATNISKVAHPGARKVEITFTKTKETSAIGARIEAQYDALKVAGIPAKDASGRKIDTYNPALELFANHMRSRLEMLHPGQVSSGNNNDELVLALNPDISLFITARNALCFDVTVNASGRGFLTTRYGSAKPNPHQLEQELKALQDHFPAIAEIYADFFRKQLPPTTIEVDYKSPNVQGQENDPINPKRLAQLRQELIVEPREDDFKYIGGLDGDIEKLKQAALGFAHPEAFRAFGVTPPRGILLQGPPGTGKTSLAMAFARDAEAVVLNVKASVIKSAYHGETERNIRGVFQLADELVQEGERVVVFIDEIESLAPARDSFGASNIDRNVTTELLQAMNVDRKNCVIIAATNAPGMVDPALTSNSSRFSEQLEIGLPNTEARVDIIRKLFLKFADKSTEGTIDNLFNQNIQIESLAQGSDGLSGADLENAIRRVLFTKAVMLASTGIAPGPATNGELYQSIKYVAFTKSQTNRNYL